MKTLPHHRLSRRLLALFVLLTLWESMSRFGWLDPFYLPAASAVANVLIELVASGQLWPHLQATLVAAFGGLVAGGAVGFAFTGAVVGEFVASSRGLGYLLQFAQSTYNAALTIALIVVTMTFVLLLFALSERLERRLLRWR